MILCECYKNGAELVINNVDFLQNATKESKIMNTIVLYKIMRDFSQDLEIKIEDMLRESMFRNTSTEFTQRFVKYII